MANWDGFKTLRDSWKPLLEGITTAAARWWQVAKNGAVGAGGVAGAAKGAAGGAVGIGQQIIDKSAGLVGGTVGTVGQIYKRFPIAAGIATAFFGYFGLKGWLKRREAKNEVGALRTANDLVATRMENNDLQNALAYDSASTGLNYPEDPNYFRNRARGGAATPAGGLVQPNPRT